MKTFSIGNNNALLVIIRICLVKSIQISCHMMGDTKILPKLEAWRTWIICWISSGEGAGSAVAIGKGDGAVWEGSAVAIGEGDFLVCVEVGFCNFQLDGLLPCSKTEEFSTSISFLVPALICKIPHLMAREALNFSNIPRHPFLCSSNKCCLNNNWNKWKGF